MSFESSLWKDQINVNIYILWMRLIVTSMILCHHRRLPNICHRGHQSNRCYDRLTADCDCRIPVPLVPILHRHSIDSVAMESSFLCLLTWPTIHCHLSRYCWSCFGLQRIIESKGEIAISFIVPTHINHIKWRVVLTVLTVLKWLNGDTYVQWNNGHRVRHLSLVGCCCCCAWWSRNLWRLLVACDWWRLGCCCCRDRYRIDDASLTVHRTGLNCSVRVAWQRRALHVAIIDWRLHPDELQYQQKHTNKMKICSIKPYILYLLYTVDVVLVWKICMHTIWQAV